VPKTSRKSKPKGASKLVAKSALTRAFHSKAKDGTNIVGIGNLRVLITHEGEAWFAQGLEIDYAAQGNSLNDVMKQFEEGLAATIHENLRVYGNIEKLLKVAPSEIWKEFFLNPEAIRNRHSQLSIHGPLEQLYVPFEGIDYLELQPAA
jgi:hypothetical protein